MTSYSQCLNLNIVVCLQANKRRQLRAQRKRSLLLMNMCVKLWLCKVMKAVVANEHLILLNRLH